MSSPISNVAILGSGLAGSLLAWRLGQTHPEIKVHLIDRRAYGPSDPVADQTWSFHDTDVLPHQLDWLRPLLRKSWPTQTVRFPGSIGTLSLPYHSLSSLTLARALNQSPRPPTRIVADVQSVSGGTVRLSSSEAFQAELIADVIFDARGLPPLGSARLGYQKFMGLELELEEPHGLSAPVIMDAGAEIEQIDGFRFIYLLPWSATRILVEDTRYSDTATLDQARIESDILHYVAQKGWRIRERVGREIGALPIPLDDPGIAEDPQLLPIGMRGGDFHFVTGYSLPATVQAIDRICALSHWDRPSIRQALALARRESRQDRAYWLILNRMLLLAALPAERRRIFSRFYGLSPALIARFYGGRLTYFDKLRLLAGKPPVSIARAVRSLVAPAALARLP